MKSMWFLMIFQFCLSKGSLESFNEGMQCNFCDHTLHNQDISTYGGNMIDYYLICYDDARLDWYDANSYCQSMC